MGGEMIRLREGIPSPDFLTFLNVLAVQHIGKLLKISHNDDIFGTGEGKCASGQIHLGCLIYDEVIVGILKVQGTLNGVGCAQNYRIFLIELFGLSAEVPHLKALARLFPVELFTQLRLE